MIFWVGAVSCIVHDRERAAAWRLSHNGTALEHEECPKGLFSCSLFLLT